jgi:hypothetical protein
MSNNFEVMNEGQFAFGCKQVKLKGEELHALIQTLAVQAIYFSITIGERQGDCQPANRLLESMHNSTRKDSLVAYLEKFGQLAWSKEKKGMVDFKREKVIEGEIALEWNPDYADKVQASDWAEAKAAPAIKSMYDCDVEVRRLLGQMEKAIAKGAKNSHLYEVIAGAYNAEQLDLQSAMYDGLAARGYTADNLVARGCDLATATKLVKHYTQEAA